MFVKTRVFNSTDITQHRNNITRQAVTKVQILAGHWRIQWRAPPVQFLSFSCVFWQKSCQIIGFLSNIRSWRPRLGNSGSATAGGIECKISCCEYCRLSFLQRTKSWQCGEILTLAYEKFPAKKYWMLLCVGIELTITGLKALPLSSPVSACISETSRSLKCDVLLILIPR